MAPSLVNWSDQLTSQEDIKGLIVSRGAVDLQVLQRESSERIE